VRRLYTPEQFARLADADQRDPQAAVASAMGLAEPAEPGESGRLIRYVLSTGAVGRDFHVVEPEAWQLRNYLKNPVFLWAHDDKQPPIGRMVQIGDVAGVLKGTVEYAERDLNPFADMIYRLTRAGYLNAVSTSWQPLEWSLSKDRARPGGIDFSKVDLLEVSQVPIPALPEALATARSQGIDTSPLYEWAERILDSGGMVFVPRAEIENLRRAAKMASPVSRATGSDWKVGASKNLPIEDSDSWDGAAAQKSIFEWAGGDEFSPAKARNGFLVYDASEPDKRGSYKLPIAHVVDGELKVPKGAIRAALSRISQTDIPDDVKKSAQTVLDHYKEKAGIGEDDESKEERALVGEEDEEAQEDADKEGGKGDGDEEQRRAASAGKSKDDEEDEDEDDEEDEDKERAGTKGEEDDEDEDDEDDEEDDDEEEEDTKGKGKAGKGKTATTKGKGGAGRRASPVSRRIGAPRFRRGLYECGQLGYLLMQLGFMHDHSTIEEALEQDEDSDLPQLLGEALQAAADAFLAMAKEETAELLEQIEGGSDELPDGERAWVARATSPRTRAFRRGIACVRAGRTLSNANQEKLATAHGHLDRALKHHRAQGEHQQAVSEHAEELRSLHKRAVSTLAELGYDHHRVTRAMDGMSERIEELSDRHSDACDSHSMVGRSIKSGQRCMRSVMDGAAPAEDESRNTDPESRAARLERARKLRIVPSGD